MTWEQALFRYNNTEPFKWEILQAGPHPIWGYYEIHIAPAGVHSQKDDIPLVVLTTVMARNSTEAEKLAAPILEPARALIEAYYQEKWGKKRRRS